jgi:hypothetical protein
MTGADPRSSVHSDRAQRESIYSFAPPLRGDDAREKFRVIPMHAIKNPTRLSVVALAVMLLGVFLLPMTSAAAQSASGQHVRVQRFLVLSTHPRDNTPPVLGFGPVHAKGFDKVVNNHKDVFVFPKGRLVIRHHATSRHRFHDATTCLVRQRERGHYRIVRGTGAYAGAHGHGHYHVTVTFIACSRHNPPESFVLQIKARGPIRL